MMMQGHKLAMADDDFRLRRLLTIGFLIVLAAHSLSSAFILRDKALEVYATQPLTLLYVAFALLIMWGSVCFGRRHHERLSEWMLLLQFPAVLLVVNALMLVSDYYRPLMNSQDLLNYHADAPVVFVGRVLFMSMIAVSWIVSAGILAEAWMHRRRLSATTKAAPSKPLNRLESQLLGYWAAVLLLAVVPFCQTFYPPPFH